jgi:hypothetical protein
MSAGGSLVTDVFNGVPSTDVCIQRTFCKNVTVVLADSGLQCTTCAYTVNLAEYYIEAENMNRTEVLSMLNAWCVQLPSQFQPEVLIGAETSHAIECYMDQLIKQAPGETICTTAGVCSGPNVADDRPKLSLPAIKAGPNGDCAACQWAMSFSEFAIPFEEVSRRLDNVCEVYEADVGDFGGLTLPVLQGVGEDSGDRPQDSNRRGAALCCRGFLQIVLIDLPTIKWRGYSSLVK